MRDLANFPIKDTSDLTNYPNGRLLDRSGSTRGTPINEFTNGDIHMMIDKLSRVFSIAPNNLPDNETNGYQSINLFQALVNAYVAPVLIAMIGADYANNTMYVLSGLDNVNTPGIVFFGGELFWVKAYVSGSGAVYLISGTVQADIINGMRVLKIIKGTSGTGACDFNNLNRILDSNVAATAPTYNPAVVNGGTFQADGTTPIYCRRIGRTVTIEGRLGHSSPTSGNHSNTDLAFTFPVNMRPNRMIYRPVLAQFGYSTSGAGYSAAMTTIQIATNGDVSIIATKGAYDTNGVYFNVQFDVDL